ncbi:MAG TPA: pirin family protein [Planctomycetota bacterium]|nr:pirin family protein [Planctomycetota bacterium]
MITLRRAADRGHADHGWLLSHHTFSFADYHDPRFMGFRALRVINDDVVQPSQGFGTHPHRDMEILTWVLEGELAHQDSMGTGSVIRPGEIQRMSAGTGVLHSEMNPSRDKAVHLLQIWLLPERRGIAPGYEQRDFPAALRRGRLCTLAARAAAAEPVALASATSAGAPSPVTIHQDAALLTALLAPGEAVSHELRPGRGAWLHVARGAVSLSGRDGKSLVLHAGDGAAVESEPQLRIEGGAAPGAEPLAEILLFDLA